jgi:uncharacterized membrane protein
METAIKPIFDNFIWMGWNAGLAFIPFLLAWVLFSKPKKRKINKRWVVGFIIFVLFLPNAPYIFTDIIHLYTALFQISSDIIFILVTLQYIVLLGLGFVLFARSFEEFENFLMGRWRVPRAAIRIASFFVISIGIYLGRFMRLNSWDVFLHPLNVLESIPTLFQMQGIIFVTFFVVILYLSYGFYHYLHKSIRTT